MKKALNGLGIVAGALMIASGAMHSLSPPKTTMPRPV